MVLVTSVDTNFIEIEKGLFAMDRKYWLIYNPATGTVLGSSNKFDSEDAAVERAKDYIRQGTYSSLTVLAATQVVSRSDIIVTSLK